MLLKLAMSPSFRVSDEAASAGWRNKDVFVTPLGLLVMLGYCVNSGFAGVFSEKVSFPCTTTVAGFSQACPTHRTGCIQTVD